MYGTFVTPPALCPGAEGAWIKDQVLHRRRLRSLLATRKKRSQHLLQRAKTTQQHTTPRTTQPNHNPAQQPHYFLRDRPSTTLPRRHDKESVHHLPATPLEGFPALLDLNRRFWEPLLASPGRRHREPPLDLNRLFLEPLLASAVPGATAGLNETP